MLSPTASNAPAWKDTHPAAWNVPGRDGAGPGVGVGGAAGWGAAAVGEAAALESVGKRGRVGCGGIW